MKTCSGCGTKYENIENNFHKDKFTKSGYSSHCKICKNENSRIRHKNRTLSKSEAESLPKDTCNQCNEEYPRHSKFWGPLKRSKTGFMPICKSCRNKNKNKYYNEKKEAKKEREKLKIEDEEAKMNIMYQKVLNRVEEKPGLKIGPVNISLDKYYSIKIPRREGSTRDTFFVGKLVQQCDNHIVFQNTKGIRESFLKADLMIGHEIKLYKN